MDRSYFHLTAFVLDECIGGAEQRSIKLLREVEVERFRLSRLDRFILFIDIEAMPEFHGLGIFALQSVHTGEVVKFPGEKRMGMTVRLLRNGERARVEFRSLRIFALVSTQWRGG